MAQLRVDALEYPPAGEHVGAADFVSPVRHLGVAEDAHKVGDHTRDDDGLTPCLDPLRRYYNRQARSELVGHLEACAPCTDDDGRPGCREYGHAQHENVLDLVT